jgi:hypothetical protein
MFFTPDFSVEQCSPQRRGRQAIGPDQLRLAGVWIAAIDL